MRIHGRRPLPHLLRAFGPTLTAFTATTLTVQALGWSAHWWLGLLAGFPAVILIEAVLASLSEALRARRGPPDRLGGYATASN